MSSNNPLKHYFRQPSLYIKLPTGGKWYSNNDVEFVSDHEVAVFGLTALDEILLNTPDAMLNGQALEKVLQNCVPGIKNIKKIMVPDLEAIFLSLKMASNNGEVELSRKCPKCEHENDFDVNCQHLLDTMSIVEDHDTYISFNEELIVYIRPYTLEMRQQFVVKEFEEQRTIRQIDNQSQEMDEITKTRILGESVERLSKMTFSLLAKSIEKIELVKDKVVVTDPAHINEWLVNINSKQAETIINAVNALNEIGINKNIEVTCSNCGHHWPEKLNFDPISFFAKR